MSESKKAPLPVATPLAFATARRAVEPIGVEAATPPGPHPSKDEEQAILAHYLASKLSGAAWNDVVETAYMLTKYAGSSRGAGGWEPILKDERLSEDQRGLVTTIVSVVPRDDSFAKIVGAALRQLSSERFAPADEKMVQAFNDASLLPLR